MSLMIGRGDKKLERNQYIYIYTVFMKVYNSYL
jgi:hypothetical protein